MSRHQPKLRWLHSITVLLSMLFTCRLYAGRVVSPDLRFDYTPGQYLVGPGIDALNAGATLSNRVESPVPQVAEATSLDERIGVMRNGYAQRRTHVVNLNAAMNTDAAQLKSEIRAMSVGRPLLPVVAAPVVHADPLPRYELSQFKECLKPMLKSLKELLRLQNAGAAGPVPPGQAMRNRTALLVLERDIDLSRGDGQRVGGAGVACGKYLGAAGFLTQGIVHDVKVLSALSHVDGGDFDRLLTASITAFHGNSTPEMIRVWRKYWDILSLKAEFHHAALSDGLPSWEAMKPNLAQLIFDPGLVEAIPIQREELDRVSAEGIRFAEGLKRNVGVDVR